MPLVEARMKQGWWNTDHATDLFSWAALAFMAWFAVLFAAERILNDASYFLLCMVDGDGFFVNQGRWIMPLSQWSAVMGIKAGLSMTTLITLYSLGSVIVATSAFLFVRYVLKDQRAGLAVVGTQLIGVGHAVFCPVFEFYYAAPLLVACLALLKTDRLRPLPRNLLFATLLFLVLSAHFLAMIVAVMVLVAVGIHRQRRLALVALTVLSLHAIIRANVLSAYELRAINSLWIRLDGLGWTWIFRPGRLIGHLEHAVSVYPDVVLLSLLFAVAVVKARSWYPLVVLVGGLFVLYVLQSFYFPDGTHSVYREFVDYPFAVWVVIMPWVLWPRELAGGTRWRRVLCVAMALRCLLWVLLAPTYVARVEWMRDQIAAAHEQGIRRGLVTELPAFITPCWGKVEVAPLNAMEVMLFSAEAGPSHTVALVPAHDPSMDMNAFEMDFEEKLRAENVPLIWTSTSPYFDLPPEAFRYLR
ncbi:MAG: hypothetical protein R2811_07630 [Flavobacteriales bacterium]